MYYPKVFTLQANGAIVTWDKSENNIYQKTVSGASNISISAQRSNGNAVTTINFSGV